MHIRPIEEVLYNGLSIGFRCRRSVIFGIMQEIPDGWCVGVREGNKIVFSGNYDTRKQAESALIEKRLDIAKVNQ
jgi:hypothetical protein